MNRTLFLLTGYRALFVGMLVAVLMAPVMVAASDTGSFEAGQQPALYFEVSRRGEFGAQSVQYKAIVAESFLKDPQGTPTASLVSTSYIRTNLPKGTIRPVVFVFNGGPGSAAIWTHLGLVGPRRIDFADEVNPPTSPPFALADNADSILDVVDIVLFNPPGTGFSRILPAGKPEQFFGIVQDADATVEFIKNWVNDHERWNSPRFLMGESYGTIRAAVTAKRLVGGPMSTGHMDALTLNGVILLGQAMRPLEGDLRFVTSLPSYAATAWYHGTVEKDELTLSQHVEKAQAFAAGEYIKALFAGDGLAATERRAAARTIAALTGLSAEFILEQNLRVSSSAFARELLRDGGKEAGKYDARFVLPRAASGGDPVADDPAMAQYVPAFVAALNTYMHEELGVETDIPYLAIEFRTVNSRWDYGYGPGIPIRANHAGDLATAMRRNPQLRLFVGTGYYDLVTTVGAAWYTVEHAGFDLDRVTVRNYESGHMPYLGAKSRALLASDLRQFIRAAASGGSPRSD